MVTSDERAEERRVRDTERDIDEMLRVLGMAVERVAKIHETTLDIFASEQDVRRRLFERLVGIVLPAIPAIADVKVPDEGGDFYYFVIDERKGKAWYLVSRAVHPAAPTYWWIASAPPEVRPAAGVEPEQVEFVDALRVIRLDELVRRTASRLRSVAAPMQGRRDEALRNARRLEAVAALLED